MNFKARVRVMPQAEILDPQGKAVENALSQMGISQVSEVRIGKLVEFFVAADTEIQAREKVQNAAQNLLANLIMEEFTIELTEH